jgi:hypothetical protein
MEVVHKNVHSGARWLLVCGSYAGVERFAVDELQRVAQSYLPYVLDVSSDPGGAATSDRHLLLVGTPDNNPLLEELISSGRLRAPQGAGGYGVAALESSGNAERRIMAVAGTDAEGALHGAIDLCARVLGSRAMPDDPREMRSALDGIESFAFAERPAIANRGLWTWGYVVYDYQRFLDNMARLKMNMLVLWNDCAPLNAAEVVEYAHSRGVKVLFGYHWGWGIEGLDLANDEHLAQTRAAVLETYRREYRDLNCDGIYFQTATEHKHKSLGGRSVASLACDWVNDIAGALLAEAPELYIQFGLHAISIGEHFADLAGLDQRVSIVWEDAGALPYCYEPVAVAESSSWFVPEGLGLETAAGTLDYSRKLAGLRPGTEFAMVPKGWVKLRWGVDFEHHGSFVLGRRDRAFIRRRLEERRPRWDQVNQLWLRNYPLAAEFYRAMLEVSSAGVTVTGLVEDGMFSEEIQPSVALFAETLWDPHRPDQDILELALSPYYRRAH